MLLSLLMWMPLAHAHKPSDSYLNLKWEGSTVQGQWDIALRDLDYAIGLDGDEDSAITWGELLRQRQALTAYALARLRIAVGGKPCSLAVTGYDAGARRLIDGTVSDNFANRARPCVADR